MKRNKRRKKTGRPPQRQMTSGIRFHEMGLPAGREKEISAAIRVKAAADAKAFPKHVATTLGICQHTNPLELLASLAFYGLMTSLGSDGVTGKNFAQGIEQAHVEAFQALTLTLRQDQWGKMILLPAKSAELIEHLPKLTESYIMSRWAGQTPPEGADADAIMSMQEAIRLHTQHVRNWGYFGEAAKLSNDLYAPLDSDLRHSLGFSATQVIALAQYLVKTIEERANKHFAVLANIYQGKTLADMLRRFYESMPADATNPEQILGKLPTGATPKRLFHVMQAYLDLKLPKIYTFRPADVADAVGITEQECSAALDFLALQPGALAEQNQEFIFLGNPIWQTPIISLPGEYFVAMPQLILDNIHEIVRRMSMDAKIKQALESRRAQFLEQRVEAILSQALPGAAIQSAIKWSVGTVQYETDTTVLLDRTLIIAEAKSHRVTPEALRGAPARMRTQIEELVIAPSIQSARLEQLIIAARGGNAEAAAILAPFNFDPTAIDTIVRFSVTLDNFAVLNAAEGHFRALGWLAEDHQLAPSIQIADLPIVAEILGHPALFLHYLSERIHVQHDLVYMGDELDLLGLYLETFFNLDELITRKQMVQIAGLSKPIDNFFMSREAGLDLPKPSPRLSSRFAAIIDKLGAEREDAWTTMAIAVMGAADSREQADLETQLEKLKDRIVKGSGREKTFSGLDVRPPARRKAAMVLSVTSPETEADAVAAITAKMDALMDEGYAGCIAFLYNSEETDAGYTMAFLRENLLPVL